MYFGELAEKSNDYYFGHMKGVARAFDDVIFEFQKLAYYRGKDRLTKSKFTAEEVIELVIGYKRQFISMCDVFGMGLEDTGLDEE